MIESLMDNFNSKLLHKYIMKNLEAKYMLISMSSEHIQMSSIQTHDSNVMTFGSKDFSFATFNDP